MPFYKTHDWEQEKEKIYALGKEGKTLAEIAKLYGVSRQRMKQITDKYFPNWKDNCGSIVRRRKTAEQYYAKWGDKNDTDLYQRQRHKFRAKKANAIRVGWEWTIEFGDLDWPTHCPILGMALDYYVPYAADNSVSFDQIDAGKGYVKGNVQLISWRANRIKSDGTAHEHRAVADFLDKLITTNA